MINRWISKSLKQDLTFITVSLCLLISEPALPYAPVGTEPYVNFTQSLSLTRGIVDPGEGPESLVLNQSAACDLVIKNFGWDSCSGLDLVVFGQFPEIDGTYFMIPNSEGYVSFEDWQNDTIGDDVKEMEKQLRVGLKEQSKTSGRNIFFERWSVPPTLNKDQSYMYYAYVLNWDGESSLNVMATYFDRKGYMEVNMVPLEENLSKDELENLIEKTLATYRPKQNQSYFDFQDGDKVAAAGAVGVLATLLGVKYGKGAATGILAVALVLLKKFWFVLLFPLVFIGRLFKKKDH